MPVPAGPMPKMIVCLSIDSTYRFWFSVFGRIVRPRLDRMFSDSTSAGRSCGLGAQHADGALDGLGGDALAGADDRDQLVEQPLDQRDLGGLAAQRDLVAADVDVGVEGLLDEREVLVAGAEEGHHGDAVGHHDRVGGQVPASCRTRCQTVSWAALGPTSRSVLDVPVRAGPASLRECVPVPRQCVSLGLGPDRGLECLHAGVRRAEHPDDAEVELIEPEDFLAAQPVPAGRPADGHRPVERRRRHDRDRAPRWTPASSPTGSSPGSCCVAITAWLVAQAWWQLT